MPFRTQDGTTVLFPTVSDRALANVTPLAVLSKISDTNGNLRHKSVAVHDVDSVFRGMLARASVTSYEIKAECKGILERWESSPDWASVRQILRRSDFDRPGLIPNPSIPLETHYQETKTVLPVQLMSERTREKLACKGKTLYVYLPSRVESAALATMTHIHLLGHKGTGGSKLYEVEIVTAFHPSVAIEFESHSLRNQLLDELPTLAFLLESDRAANVAVKKFDARAHNTIYTLGSGPMNKSVDIYESLKHFFINKGYIANSDVVFREEEGVKENYVKVRGTRGPTFMRKLSAVHGSLQDRLVPATLASTCSICRPNKQRARLEYQAHVQVETQSRLELDFCQTGPPKVKLPGSKVTPVGFKRNPDTRYQLKRKRDVDSSNSPGPKPLDDGHEDDGRQLKIAKEALMSKFEPENLAATIRGPDPLHDARKDRNKKGDVVEEGLPLKRKRKSSPDSVTDLALSRSGNKEGREKPKFADKEVPTSEDCAEPAKDLLTELERSLNF